MLYTMCFDSSKYMLMLWDATHVRQLCGGDIDHRVDINGAPISHAGIFKEPVRVSFAEQFDSDKGLERPDLCVFQGRLYLNQKAYDALSDLIKNDGEFLPVIDDLNQSGYVFTSMRIAEDNDALDKKLSRKNEWGDVENLAFHEDKVSDWSVFRCEYDIFMSLHCQHDIKNAIENTALQGILFTSNLGDASFLQEKGAKKHKLS